jgi:hypothetical protein
MRRGRNNWRSAITETDTEHFNAGIDKAIECSITIQDEVRREEVLFVRRVKIVWDGKMRDHVIAPRGRPDGK